MGLLVRDIMSTDVISISSSLGLDAFEQELTNKKIGGGPVVDGRDVLGVVSRSDVIRHLNVENTIALVAFDYYDAPYTFSNIELDLGRFGAVVGERMAHLTVKDIMNSAIVSVSPDDTLMQAADLMLEKSIHRLLVLDGSLLVGLVSSTDFVRLYSKK